ncbi:EAL domain-containing protein [Aeromonas jandaei]|uniref:EAL domain-containing protein n=1 Tax=Aeromonas jandaei TaxID=650 RepID=UPI002AA0E3A5|nr:EAL domain-containing protein [Aeromonas jandaei]
MGDSRIFVARKIIKNVDNILLRSSDVARDVLPLVGLPCVDILPKIRKEAVFSPYVRSIKIVKDGVVYCNSVYGGGSFRWRYYYVDFFTDKLNLVQGTPLRNDLPTILLKKRLVNGAGAIVAIEVTHVINALNLNGNLAWLQVGGQWIDNDGRFYAGRPHSIKGGAIKLSSTIFPFNVYYADTDVASGFAGTSFMQWMINRGGELFFIVVFSLCFSLVLYYLIGRKASNDYALRRGIRMQEFVPFVQPIIDSQTRGLSGVEVLTRWRHPTLGLITPDLFINDAEVTGLIVPMTSQVMNKLAEKLSSVQAFLPTPFHVSVNVSSSHFKSMVLVEDCASFLRRFQQGSIVLTLELTERELLIADDEARFIFEKIRSMGVQFSLDDFGTGHSSLAYLKQFDIDAIKIDKSFVRQIGWESIAHKIVDNIIELGMSLGITVIAEGVETDFQANYLRDKKVDYLQGYLFSMPYPVEDFVDTLPRNEHCVVRFYESAGNAN